MESNRIDTGLDNLKGSRIKQIEKYIDTDNFFLTYGDGVSSVNIGDLLTFHRSHGKIGTVTGVLPPSRFGELVTNGHIVESFNEKPQVHAGGLINGGFFVFDKRFFKYLSTDDSCILERQPLEDLVRDKELCIYKHEGFWQCMDTYRDFEYLNGLWRDGKAEWKNW